ncbi:MAG TPA: hypothetical protein VHC90_01500 [Bryobacteraceae bacterium]|nr:hypothetical protein [Bryobacteraceae bacterium]
MPQHWLRVGALLAPALLFLRVASATDLPRYTFNELTDSAEVVATGNITRTWADWDPDHAYIWTHYELAVTDVEKGTAGSSIDIAEPGGSLNGVRMSIAGATGYSVGEHVLVFLSRMPNGYLRTAGFGQGKFFIESNNHLRAEIALKPSAVGGVQMRSLDGMSLNQAAQLVGARVRVFRGVR